MSSPALPATCSSFQLPRGKMSRSVSSPCRAQVALEMPLGSVISSC
jgi:hypothetical protein